MIRRAGWEVVIFCRRRMTCVHQTAAREGDKYCFVIDDEQGMWLRGDCDDWLILPGEDEVVVILTDTLTKGNRYTPLPIYCFNFLRQSSRVAASSSVRSFDEATWVARDGRRSHPKRSVGPHQAGAAGGWILECGTNSHVYMCILHPCRRTRRD